MKHFAELTWALGLAAILLLANTSIAQTTTDGGNRANPANGGGNRGNRGNANPAQMRERMMERYKESLGVKNDDEWKVIQERIEKVLEAQREMRGVGMGGRGGRRGGQDNNGPRNDPASSSASNTAGAELQKALEDNASGEVINAKLANYREWRKTAEAKLEKAQAELQKVLVRKQEARLVLMGLLK
jgi:hypothetical protein